MGILPIHLPPVHTPVVDTIINNQLFFFLDWTFGKHHLPSELNTMCTANKGAGSTGAGAWRAASYTMSTNIFADLLSLRAFELKGQASFTYLPAIAC